MQLDQRKIKMLADSVKISLSDEELADAEERLKDVSVIFSDLDKCDTRGFEPARLPGVSVAKLRDDKCGDSGCKICGVAGVPCVVGEEDAV